MTFIDVIFYWPSKFTQLEDDTAHSIAKCYKLESIPVSQSVTLEANFLQTSLLFYYKTVSQYAFPMFWKQDHDDKILHSPSHYSIYNVWYAINVMFMS